jgi:bla regulator protein BlaR1
MIPGLVDHLWQSTLFVGAAWLLSLALRRNQAQVRYWVWFTASAKFLIPFSVLVGLGALVPRHAAAPPIQVQWVSIVEQIGQPSIALPPVPVSVPRANHDYITTAAVVLWACGFAAIAICWLGRWKRVHALRRSAALVNTFEFPAPILSAPGLVEPGIVGIFRPVLLLPEGIEDRLDRTQLDAILAHELCHVRRRDNLTATIHMIVQAIFWFHPLVWWLGARLVDERERACDEEVLRIFGQPKAYAEGILNVCKMYVESRLVCVSGVTGANLKRRIEAIMKNRMMVRLNFTKKAALAAAGIAALALPITVGVLDAPLIRAQSAAIAKPKFEVASIRPCEPASPGPGKRGFSVSPGRLHVTCVSLNQMTQMAYGVDFRYPMEGGGPAWVRSDDYSIEAKADGNPSAQAMQGPMLQALLEDRFKLKIRRETKEVSAYALTVAKNGFKLQPLKEGSCTPYDPLKPPTDLTPAAIRAAIASTCANSGSMGLHRNGPAGLVVADFHGITLDDFSKALDRAMDRSVVNKTGIMGMFDVHFDFAPDEATPAFMPGGRMLGFMGPPNPSTQADPVGGPSIFTAMQEHLGLKLESAKGSAEFFAIESAERPSEN